MDFKQRDLFEFKDYVQNDGTNDYYKHFLVYQYITMLSYIAELKYVEVLDLELGQTDFSLQQDLQK